MLVIKCLNDDDCMKPRPFLSRTLKAILTQKLSPPRVGRREERTPDLISSSSSTCVILAAIIVQNSGNSIWPE